jgi:hypothetical protein
VYADENQNVIVQNKGVKQANFSTSIIFCTFFLKKNNEILLIKNNTMFFLDLKDPGPADPGEAGWRRHGYAPDPTGAAGQGVHPVPGEWRRIPLGDRGHRRAHPAAPAPDDPPAGGHDSGEAGADGGQRGSAHCSHVAPRVAAVQR